jgi:type VI secretion system protein ImpJ
MHLAPHHFQAQNRYFEVLQHFAVSALFPHSFGLIGLEMDEEAIRNGTVAVLHARGIMPDGLVFHIPHDPPPEPLALEERFSPTARAHRVFLEIAPYREIGPNVNENGAGAADGDVRFRETPTAVRDVLSGGHEQTIPLAGKRFRLVLDEVDSPSADAEASDEAASPDRSTEEAGVRIPLARIRRDGAGHFIYDPDFVPPSIQIGASRAIMDRLARIVEILEDRSRSLAAERRGSPGGPGDGGTAELVGYWFTHAVNTHLPVLRHQMEVRSGHPARLFADLSALAGALSTFSLSGDAAALPIYRHEAPEEGFATLEREIRQGLETVVPTRVVQLPVTMGDGYFHTASARDRRVLDEGVHWYLGVRSSASRAEVLDGVPRLVKLCSARHIERLVREAYPGLGVDHAPTPPAGLSPRPGTEYFRIRRTEPCWRTIAESEEVGIYIPGSIPDPELELIAVLEADAT